MSEKSWPTFLVALGFFLITISPLTGAMLLNSLAGLALVILGFYLIKKK